MRQIRKGSYSVPRAVIRKHRLRRRTHDASDDPYLDKPFFDDTRIHNTVQRSHQEYLLRRQAQAIFERQKSPISRTLDMESRKEEIAKRLAEWANTPDVDIEIDWLPPLKEKRTTDD